MLILNCGYHVIESCWFSKHETIETFWLIPLLVVLLKYFVKIRYLT